MIPPQHSFQMNKQNTRTTSNHHRNINNTKTGSIHSNVRIPSFLFTLHNNTNTNTNTNNNDIGNFFNSPYERLIQRQTQRQQQD